MAIGYLCALALYNEFGSCPYCLGFLSRHAKAHITEIWKSELVRIASNALVNSMLFRGDTKFRRLILDTLCNDDISKIRKTDNVILGIGMLLFEKYANDQKELIKQSIRQLARLLQVVGESNFHQPHAFWYSNQCCENIMPSKLQFNRENGIWNSIIPSKRKINSSLLLPLTQDLLKLNIMKEIELFKVLLQNNPCETTAWLRLAQLTLTRIILFNKRRSGETSCMTIKQYSSCPHWSIESTQELQDSLTPFEKELAKSMKLIQIHGKRGRTVPFLLRVEMCINLLISTRMSAGINPSNPYIFARLSELY